MAEAATLSGQGERTIYRWLNEPTFRDALAEAETRLIDDVSRRLLQLQAAALDTLESLLSTDTPGASDSIKLRAAQLALDHLLKLREMRDIEARLQAVEELLAINGVGGGV